MGRGKLKMSLIEKEKSRVLTFKKRKQGLMKKLHELTTLCDVSACMVVGDGSSSVSVWPEDSPDEVRRLVDDYKSKASAGSVKSYGLPDFFSDRRKEIEGEIEKLRKNKYPTWDDLLFSGMEEFQLRNIAAQLRLKAHNVRIQLLMREREREREIISAQIPVMNVQPSYYYDLPPLPPPPPLPLPLQYYAVAPMNGDYLNYDSMAMMDGSVQQQQGYWVEEHHQPWQWH